MYEVEASGRDVSTIRVEKPEPGRNVVLTIDLELQKAVTQILSEGLYHGSVTYALPLIMGHEIVGRIARIGPVASRRWGVQEGDRVTVEAMARGGFCRACIEGQYRFCKAGFGYGSPTAADAMLWQFASAESSVNLPRISAENCSVHWLPTPSNWGMPTYWIPGLPGRLVVPGFSIGADSMASSVALAKARAASRYCGIS